MESVTRAVRENPYAIAGGVSGVLAVVSAVAGAVLFGVGGPKVSHLKVAGIGLMVGAIPLAGLGVGGLIVHGVKQNKKDK